MGDRKVEVNKVNGSYVVSITDYRQVGGPYTDKRVERCESETYLKIQEILLIGVHKWRGVMPKMEGLSDDEERRIKSALEKTSQSLDAA